MIDRIRNVVRAHYSFTYENPSRRHVVELLEHDAFAYEVPKEVSMRFVSGRAPLIILQRKRLFLAEVIVKALVAVFFSTTKGGLGLRVATQHMFKVIRPGSLIPVVVGIRHALTEFLAGERRVIKFESSFAEGTLRSRNAFNIGIGILTPRAAEAQEQIKATWDIQTEKRKKKILELLTSKVRRQRGLDDQASSPTVRPLPNPYRNNLDDLEDLLVPSTPLVTETPYGSQPSNVHGIEALADYNGDEAVEGHGGNKVFRGNNDQASEGYNGDKSRTTSEVSATPVYFSIHENI